jgi:hypothetical protein
MRLFKGGDPAFQFRNFGLKLRQPEIEIFGWCGVWHGFPFFGPSAELVFE